MQPVDDCTLAYLAGAIDADGHITITRSLRTKGKRYGHTPTYYHPRIGFTSTERVVPDLFQSVFGGSICEHQPKNASHKRVYIWSAGTAMVRDISRAILPFLRLKVRQAELTAALCEMIGAHHAEQKRTQKPPYRITNEQLAERELIWLEVSALNKPRNRRVHPIGGADGVEHKASPPQLQVNPP